MRHAFAVVAVLTVVSSACADDSGEEADTPTPTTATTTTTGDPSTTTTEGPSSTTTTLAPVDAERLLADGRSCTSPDGFGIGYPSDWEAVADCGQFGPAPLEEPERGTDERPGIVAAYVGPLPFGDVSEPAGSGERERALSVIDGRPAVRVARVTGDDALYPAGTEVVRWMVDLSQGTDDGDGTLFLDAVDLAATDQDPGDAGSVPFDRAGQIVDLMARSLTIEAGDPPVVDHVVARYEGGGAPFTVTVAASASTPATCFTVAETEASPVCVEGLEEPDGIAIAAAEGPAGPITVGIVGPEVWDVELSTDGSTLTYVPVPYPGRDSRAFAVPLDAGALSSISLRWLDGTVVDEPEPSEVRRPV